MRKLKQVRLVRLVLGQGRLVPGQDLIDVPVRGLVRLVPSQDLIDVPVRGLARLVLGQGRLVPMLVRVSPAASPPVLVVSPAASPPVLPMPGQMRQVLPPVPGRLVPRQARPLLVRALLAWARVLMRRLPPKQQDKRSDPAAAGDLRRSDRSCRRIDRPV